jgi:hypothetical protein
VARREPAIEKYHGVVGYAQRVSLAYRVIRACIDGEA